MQFLRDMGGKNGFPKLLSASATRYGDDKEFFIAREKINGVLLSDKIRVGENFDSWSVIKQILKQSVYLESKSYIITMICSFGMFCTKMKRARQQFDRNYTIHRSTKFLTALKKHIPTELYNKLLTMKVSENFFAQLYEILFETKIKSAKIEKYTLAELELLAVENLLDTLIKP